MYEHKHGDMEPFVARDLQQPIPQNPPQKARQKTHPCKKALSMLVNGFCSMKGQAQKAQAQTHPSIHACHMDQFLADVRSEMHEVSTGTRRGGTAHVHATHNVAMAAPEAPCSPAPRSPPPARARCHSVQSAAPTANFTAPFSAHSPLEAALKQCTSGAPAQHLPAPKFPATNANANAMRPCPQSRAFVFLVSGPFFQIVSARLNTASSQPWSLLYPFPTLEPTSVQSTSHSFFFFSPTLFQSFPFRHSPFRSTKDYKKTKTKNRKQKPNFVIRPLCTVSNLQPRLVSGEGTRGAVPACREEKQRTVDAIWPRI